MIARRLENLLGLDYPPDRLEILVASDASDDRTDAIVEEFASRDARVRLLRCPRGGKSRRRTFAVKETSGEIVAFSDANSTWAPGRSRQARAQLHRSGRRLCLRPALTPGSRADGTNVEGSYWRLETWLREQEAITGSITGATARSTPCAAPTTQTSILASGTTSSSVPDGAARSARGVRPGGRCVREALAPHRGRVRPQGADVGALGRCWRKGRCCGPCSRHTP